MTTTPTTPTKQAAPAADVSAKRRGDFTPAPGAAPPLRMIASQAALETRLMLRNGEQLLLTIVIPVLMLVLFSAEPLVSVSGGPRVDFFAPGLLGAAVLSTAFTGQAIGTGFERRYGVLKRLGTTPLSRTARLTAKSCAVLVVEIIQVVLLTVIAFALGWHPHGSPLGVFALLVLGTAAFSALALLIAGSLRAEATLALANFVFLLLLAGGGVVVPLAKFPAAVRPFLDALPIGALTNGLRDVLQHGAVLPWAPAAILAAWVIVLGAATARTFKWE
jgi:ABC-2 type transport system permease protein